MARNANEGGDGSDEGDFIFSWKMFTSWDYLIGNPETADNKYASITTSFKVCVIDDNMLIFIHFQQGNILNSGTIYVYICACVCIPIYNSFTDDW